MSTTAISAALLTAWSVAGIAWLMRWKIREPGEITLLDVVCALILGATFGALIPLAALLYSVKLRKP